VPFLDVPLRSWADATMKAMNGAQAPSLWDGTPLGAGHGYMDGVVPATDAGSAGDGAADAATWTLLTTKSTRPNALMAEAINVAFNTNQDATLIRQLPSILPLLVREETTVATLHTSFLTVLESQQAYLRGASAGFAPLDAGAHPTSYAASAVSAALDGLNQQLPAQTP
jgi:hypothetical protein